MIVDIINSRKIYSGEIKEENFLGRRIQYKILDEEGKKEKSFNSFYPKELLPFNASYKEMIEFLEKNQKKEEVEFSSEEEI